MGLKLLGNGWLQMRKSPRKKGDIHAVAEEAGVSLMTVSRAMRGVEGVSEQRRKDIISIARRMNYVPNSNARALAVDNSNLIGVSLPNLFNDVFADILSGMRGAIEYAGYSSIVDTTDYSGKDELAWLDRLLTWRPVGVVLTGVDHDPALRVKLRAAEIPTLETWDISEDPIDICVGIDHRAAGRLIGNYIVSLGYRRPVYVGTMPGRDLRAEDRAAGIADAFSAVDIGPLPRIFAPDASNFVMGAQGFSKALESHAPDVVFFLSDHYAVGGLMTAIKMGISVPEKIGIVGYNDLAINSILPQRLTTVRTPRRQMGIMGARNLLARINNAQVDRSIALPVEVIEGETTKQQ